MQDKHFEFNLFQLNLFLFVQEPSCLYSFKSIADIERHMIIQHAAKGGAVNPFGYPCNFKQDDGQVCGKLFKTRYYLGKHKTQAKHIQKKVPKN